MKFSSIYDLVIPLWGDEIDISDYKIEKITSNNPDGKTYDWLSKSSKNLSQKWNEAEKIIGLDNPYADLMVWTMYQVFHKVSEKLFIENNYKLFPKEINKISIEEQYFKNLNDGEWIEELKGYVNDIL